MKEKRVVRVGIKERIEKPAALHILIRGMRIRGPCMLKKNLTLAQSHRRGKQY
jgi:hypothetical protein